VEFWGENSEYFHPERWLDKDIPAGAEKPPIFKDILKLLQR